MKFINHPAKKIGGEKLEENFFFQLFSKKTQNHYTLV